MIKWLHFMVYRIIYSKQTAYNVIEHKDVVYSIDMQSNSSTAEPERQHECVVYTI